MPKVKVMLVSLLAIAAIGAVASPQAFAEHEFLVNKKALAENETKEIAGAGGRLTLEVPAASSRWDFLCYGWHWLRFSLISRLRLTWILSCTHLFVVLITTGVPRPLSGCKISDPTFESTGTIAGAGEYTLTGKGAEEKFGEFEVKAEKEVENECLVAPKKGETVKFQIKGKMACSSPLAQEESVVHEVQCTPGGSSLKSGTEEAKLWGTGLLKVVGASAENWSST